MSKAIGMAEYQTVSAGIKAADLMIKTADVEVIEAQVVCPGKYIIILSGDLSAVKAAVDAAENVVKECGAGALFCAASYFLVVKYGNDRDAAVALTV